MGIKKFFSNFGKKNEESIPNHVDQKNKLSDWSNDYSQSVAIQRNFLLVLLIISFVVILFSLGTIRYLKGTQSISPFVIEIDKKSGIPTVVTPLSIKTYSSDEAVKRYFIVKYIRAREGYLSSTFNRDYFDVVRVLSNSDVYYGNYRPKFNTGNPSSPYNLYGKSSHRDVGIKSIIFPSSTSAQIRVKLEVLGQINMEMNKIIYMEFNFFNLKMNSSDRLINPLGFQVTLYRMDDEN